MAMFKYSQFKLSNNLECLYLPVESSKAVLVSLLGKVGRRAEKGNEIGAAHFLEHLFFDGTKSRPTSFEINKFLENYGGKHNGYTTSETVEYFVKILSKHAEIAFDFVSDVFLNSLLKEIETERKVIAQEAAAKKDNPDDILFRMSLANLYPNQAIGRNIYDEELNLLNINETVLRKYMDRTYNAENFVLTIAGNITLEKAKKLANKYFKKIKSGKELFLDKSEIRSDQNLVITKKGFAQSKLSINFRSYPTGSLESTQSWILGIILGAGWSSRLFQRLRSSEKLVYSIHTHQRKFSDTGYLGVTTFVNEKNVQKAINIIFEEIDKLLKKGVTEEELAKAKNKFLTDLLFNFEDLYSYSQYFGIRLLLKRNIKTQEEIMKEVDDVSCRDLIKVANYIFSDKPKINLLTNSLESLNIPKIAE